MKNIDFLPQRYVDRLIRRQYNRRNLFWASAIVVALGLLYVTNDARIRSASAALSEYREEQLVQEQIKSRMKELHGRQAELWRHLELVERVDDHAPVALVLSELFTHLGEAMAIRSLELARVGDSADRIDAGNRAGPADTASDDRHVITRVRLQGVAPGDVEIGILYGRLASSPLFDEVELHFTRESVEANHRMRVFEISFQIVAVSMTGVVSGEINEG